MKTTSLYIYPNEVPLSVYFHITSPLDLLSIEYSSFYTDLSSLERRTCHNSQGQINEPSPSLFTIHKPKSKLSGLNILSFVTAQRPLNWVSKTDTETLAIFHEFRSRCTEEHIHPLQYLQDNKQLTRHDMPICSN